MLRAFFVIFVLCMIAMVAVLGFRGQRSTQPPTEVFPDMVRQPKVRAQAPLDFFADGRGPRLPVAGTVPVGYEMPKPKTEGSPPGMTGDAPEEAHMRIAFSAGTDYFNTGKMGDQWGTGSPLPVTRELMERGQQRFNITCAMCHGASAAGNGITKQYGLATVVSLQDDRLRKMSDGEIFNTITNGKNTMMAYGPNIVVADRWLLLLTCAHCNAASTRPLPMFPKIIARKWTNRRHRRRLQRVLQNERAFTYATDAGRRIFREQSIYGAFNSSWFGCGCEPGALSYRRISESASI